MKPSRSSERRETRPAARAGGGRPVGVAAVHRRHAYGRRRGASHDGHTSLRARRVVLPASRVTREEGTHDVGHDPQALRRGLGRGRRRASRSPGRSRRSPAQTAHGTTPAARPPATATLAPRRGDRQRRSSTSRSRRASRYRLISRAGDPMTDGNPTPGIFDGMAAYPGRGGTTILIRNHENRSRPGEVSVAGARRQALRPRRQRARRQHEARRRPRPPGHARATRCSAARTRTAPAARRRGARGSPARRSSTTARSRATSTPGTGVPHGYSFEVPADATRAGHARSRSSTPAASRTRRSRGSTASCTRPRTAATPPSTASCPDRRPREYGDLASFGGTLQALVDPRPAELRRRRRQPGRALRRRVGDDRRAQPAHRHRAHRGAGQGRGDLQPHRGDLVGRPARVLRLHHGRRAPSSARSGSCGRAAATAATLRLVYESTEPGRPPEPGQPRRRPAHRRHLGAGGRRRRAVRPRRHARAGEIYDFAKTVLSDSEFCGGCFSPDGQTFFLNQQGDRLARGRDAGDAGRRGARLHVRDLGPVRALNRSDGPHAAASAQGAGHAQPPCRGARRRPRARRAARRRRGRAPSTTTAPTLRYVAAGGEAERAARSRAPRLGSCSRSSAARPIDVARARLHRLRRLAAVVRDRAGPARRGDRRGRDARRPSTTRSRVGALGASRRRGRRRARAPTGSTRPTRPATRCCAAARTPTASSPGSRRAT